MKLSRVFLFSAVVALVFSGMAWAQAQGRPRGGCTARFASLDKNGDGYLTLDEFKAGCRRCTDAVAEERFKAMDADGNGQVSIEEFCAKGARRCSARFASLDKEGKGYITLDEFRAGCRRCTDAMAEDRFRIMDANGDGQVTAEEFCTKKGRRGRGPRSQPQPPPTTQS